jgi:hypothetical protein
MAGKILGRLNKPAIEGYKYRSPNQTNAQDYTPNLKEDAGKSVKADAERMKKGLDPTTNESQRTKDAAGRATTRMTSRAGLGGAAYVAGEEIGKKLDEKFPELGRKIVEKSGIGPAIDKIVNMRDKVELSKSAKERLNEDEDEKPSRSPRVSENESTREMLDMMGKSHLKTGGTVRSKASKRADGCAVRGFTRAK